MRVEQAHDQRGDRKERQAGSRRHPQQRQDGGAHHGGDQTPVLQHVAKGDNKQQPDCVAELRAGHDQSRAGRPHPERRSDDAQHRLRVVEVGGGQSARQRKDSDQPAGDIRRVKLSPPETSKVSPVIQPESSQARKAATGAALVLRTWATSVSHLASTNRQNEIFAEGSGWPRQSASG